MYPGYYEYCGAFYSNGMQIKPKITLQNRNETMKLTQNRDFRAFVEPLVILIDIHIER